MDVITHDKIEVSGVKFKRILSLTINHSINEHGTAIIRGEMDSVTGREDAARLNERSLVKITTKAQGQPSVLFCGVVMKTNLIYENDYLVLELTLITTSYLLDIQKRNKSFQDEGKTYGAILQEALQGSGTVTMSISDRPIGTLVMQYNETNWEFIKRIASKFNTSVSADITSEVPEVTIGKLSSKKVIMKSHETGTGLSQYIFGVATTISNMAYNGCSYQYGYLGDNFNQEGIITATNAELIDGTLKCSYSYGAPALLSNTLKVENTQVAGRMFTGEVKEVKEDKVRVHILDIDSEFDGGSNHWFPYSTAYSSSDGSGFYCMPAVGDQVRLFFPSEDEGDAFAASSVNVAPLEDPLNKMWKNAMGKEILLTPEGIRISNKNGGTDLYISLTDEEGIVIHSNKQINIDSKANININAGKELVIEGKEEVYIGSADSFIDITKDGIMVGGNRLLIN